MTEPYPQLFSPLRLRGHTLKNRMVFGAHTANMSEEGLPGERRFAYYRERARGGAGMIVVEPSAGRERLWEEDRFTPADRPRRVRDRA